MINNDTWVVGGIAAVGIVGLILLMVLLGRTFTIVCAVLMVILSTLFLLFWIMGSPKNN